MLLAIVFIFYFLINLLIIFSTSDWLIDQLNGHVFSLAWLSFIIIIIIFFFF